MPVGLRQTQKGYRREDLRTESKEGKSVQRLEKTIIQSGKRV